MASYNFDTAPDRRGTGSYKWDSTPADVLPLWVADMDFKTAPCIIEALRQRVDHGVFGYTLVTADYYEALTSWFARRYGYEIDPAKVIYTSGVVPAISAIIKALVPAGKGVIVQTPVYNCFFSSIRNNGCKVIENPLIRENLGRGLFTYGIDFDDLEKKCSQADAKMLLLCNPGNPSGRLWTRMELEMISEICRRHGVTVVSDEIHGELTAPGTSYTPYATIDPEAIVCLSPSKAFNTAGLQIANIVCPDMETRGAVDRAININEVCDVNPFGVVALKAAYTPEGEEWLTALREYLWGNYDLVRQTLYARLPECAVSRLEATYLPWIDVSPLGLEGTRAEAMLMEHGLRVSGGAIYGDNHYIRLNIACPRPVLAEALDRLCSTLGGK